MGQILKKEEAGIILQKELFVLTLITPFILQLKLLIKISAMDHLQKKVQLIYNLAALLKKQYQAHRYMI